MASFLPQALAGLHPGNPNTDLSAAMTFHTLRSSLLSCFKAQQITNEQRLFSESFLNNKIFANLKAELTCYSHYYVVGTFFKNLF